MSNIDIEYHELCRTILREGYEYVDESRGIVCKQISSYTIEVDKVFTQFPLITTKKMFTKGIVGELIWFLRGDSNIKYLNENKITIWNKDAYNWHKKLYPGTLMQQQNFGKQVLSFDDNLLLGDVGRNYGVQWRDWTIYNKDLGGLESEVTGVDQIANLIHNLIVKPMSRRHIVTAWNPAELDQTALPPCHWAFEVIPYPIGLPVSIALASQYEDLSNIPLDEEGIDYIRRKLEEYNVPQYMFDLKWHQRSVDTFLG